MTTKHHHLQRTRNTYNTCITNQEQKNKDRKTREKRGYLLLNVKAKTPHQIPCGRSINGCL
jgi:hypothetical protein